jgi:hypothetical protein
VTPIEIIIFAEFGALKELLGRLAVGKEAKELLENELL